MANGRRGRAARIIDWGTPSGVDPDTPVADLHDPDAAGRDAFVLFSDEERATLAWVLDQAERRRELMMQRDERRRWHEQWWARTAMLLGAVAAMGQMVAGWVVHH